MDVQNMRAMAKGTGWVTLMGSHWDDLKVKIFGLFDNNWDSCVGPSAEILVSLSPGIIVLC